MTEDRIAEIRARHEEGMRAGADEDRAYLLAEVDRLRAFEAAHKQLQAEIDRLHRAHQTACKGGDLLCAEIKRLTRERDEARAEAERLREVIRTIRARCVELDDSDAVSETLDITSAVLEDRP